MSAVHRVASVDAALRCICALCLCPQHTLPLPLFVPLLPDIYQHAQLFSQSELIPLGPLAAVPKLWLILGCNVVTQYPLAALSSGRDQKLMKGKLAGY